MLKTHTEPDVEQIWIAVLHTAGLGGDCRFAIVINTEFGQLSAIE